jgi:hypothetical protein
MRHTLQKLCGKNWLLLHMKICICTNGKSVNNKYLYSVVYEGLHQVSVSAVLRCGHGVHRGWKQLIIFSKTKQNHKFKFTLGTVRHFSYTIYVAVFRGGHGVHRRGKQLILFSKTKKITNLNSSLEQ